MRVAICTITCDRNEELLRLIASLRAQEHPGADVQVEVIIVDNVPGDGAARACAALGDCPLWPVRCVSEPERGIPFARNRAVAEATSTRADWIAFVDDDQTVDVNWLKELLALQARTGADVVTGPAIAKLPEGTPRWLVRSGLFDMLPYATGTPRPHAFTHNVLTRASVFGAVQPNFDERLAFSGGSDTHFFRRVHDAGFSITWSADALTYEWYPRSRATSAWALRRAYRVGVSDSYVERDVAPAGAWRRLLARALRFTLRGMVTLPRAAVQGRAALLRSARDLARALGLIGGLVGLRYQEYRPT